MGLFSSLDALFWSVWALQLVMQNSHIVVTINANRP
jgi:hypothetical protein